MKKKLLSFLLALVMILTLLPLSACGNGSAGEEADIHEVTQGELLDKICEVFGMTTCQQETAYFPSVSASNPHFQSVQACVEWNIIEKDVQDYDVAARVTRGALALAVVNAAQLASENATEQEKLAIAAQRELVLVKHDGSIDEKKKVKREEMENAVTVAQAIWATPQYETLSQYTVSDGVTDFGVGNAKIQAFTIDTNTDTVTMPAGVAENLRVGAVYLLPAKNGFSAMVAHRVGSIIKDGETVIITNDDAGLTLDDVVGELHMQSTFVPDFTEQAIIDGNGNIIQWEPTGNASEISAAGLGASAHFSSTTTRPIQGEKLAFSDGIKGKLDFKVNGVKIKGEVTSSAIKFAATFPINDAMEISQSFEISDFNVSAKVDRDKFKRLQDARLQFDYKTETATTFKSNLAVSSAQAPNAYSWSDDYMSGLDGLLQDIAYDNSVSGFNYDGTHAKGCSKSIGIATIPLGTICGFGTVNLEIKLEFTVKGSVELKLSTTAVSGVQYSRKGGLRAISSKNTDTDLDLQAGLEALLYMGGVMKAFGFNIIDIGIKIGAGAAASSVVHLADYSKTGELGMELAAVNSDLPADLLAVASRVTLNGTKKVETCTEISAFFILRITAGTNSLVGKFSKLEVELCGAANAPFLGCPFHIEDGQVVPACTRSYRSAEEIADDLAQNTQESPASEEEQGVTTDGQPSGEFDHLDISNYYVALATGESELVTISALPKGYTEMDIVCASDNNAIAVITNDGIITAVAEGTTEVRFATSDGKFSCRCAVSVKAGESIDGNFLSSAGNIGRLKKL